MTKNINHKALAKILLIVTKSPIVIIVVDDRVECAMQNTLNGHQELSLLKASPIEHILDLKNPVEREKLKGVTFAVTAKTLQINVTDQSEYNFELNVIDDSLMILCAVPSISGENYGELLPRMHYLTNMIQSQYEGSQQLTQTVVGSVILNEAKEISNVIARLLNV